MVVVLAAYTFGFYPVAKTFVHILGFFSYIESYFVNKQLFLV